MDFMEVIRKRYSVRDYQDKSVEKSKLDIVLEAGRIAPTARNGQPQILIVANDEQSLQKIDKATKRFGAPVCIIVCADHDQTWKRSYDDLDSAHIDASIITDHMMLAATDIGLGSLWICRFEPDIIKKEFNIPEGVEPVNILCLGYATKEAAASEAASSERHSTRRKPLSETVKFGSF